jgi:hypothetical protein
MKLWKDGRSGPAGCVAGNLVLADIERFGESLALFKGTTFTGQSALYVGRVCAKDDYLQEGMLHWANLSPSQHQALSHHGKELFYLFITATREPAIHYWKVPGRVLGRFIGTLPIKRSDHSCWIRIREENGKQFLEGGNQTKGKGPEVTQYHHEIPLGRHETAALKTAFQKPTLAADGAGEITAEQLVRLNTLVKDLGGIAVVRRALGILDDLKA